MMRSKIRKLLTAFVSASAEKDGDLLLKEILNDAIDIVNCDAGTIYILNANRLEFKYMITKSMNIKKGGKNEKNILPAVKLVKSNVCAYSVLENKTINIPDVYESELFDFSGPKNYDKLTKYKTKSMLVIPMQDDKGEIIGVMQLLNAKDIHGNLISFSKNSEMIVSAIASLTAIRLTNMNYTDEIKLLMQSIVQTFAEIIYLRTPYNVTHTNNMEIYARNFIAWLNKNEETGYKFTEENKHLFIMSIWLHDIGKLIIPLEIMDKETRLSVKHERVMTRLDIIKLTIKIKALQNNENPDAQLQEVEDIRDFVNKVNISGRIDEEAIERVKQLAQKTYIDDEGKEKPWFMVDEIEDLSIIAGTLTPYEREIIQKHATYTEKILNKMKFKYEYSIIPSWASAHHELLDGSGYPKGLNAEQLSTETRILTILDIFDGLFADDRPYKKQTPIEKTFRIMNSMADEGKLDKELLALFIQSRAWEDSTF